MLDSHSLPTWSPMSARGLYARLGAVFFTIAAFSYGGVAALGGLCVLLTVIARTEILPMTAPIIERERGMFTLENERRAMVMIMMSSAVLVGVVTLAIEMLRAVGIVLPLDIGKALKLGVGLATMLCAENHYRRKFGLFVPRKPTRLSYAMLFGTVALAHTFAVLNEPIVGFTLIGTLLLIVRIKPGATDVDGAKLTKAELNLNDGFLMLLVTAAIMNLFVSMFLLWPNFSGAHIRELAISAVLFAVGAGLFVTSLGKDGNTGSDLRL